MCIPESRKMNPISLALKILADQCRFAFKEKNFELKRKKNLDYLPLPLYQIKAHHKSQRKDYSMAWRVGQENDTGIVLWQILQLQNLQHVPHSLGHHL